MIAVFLAMSPAQTFVAGLSVPTVLLALIKLVGWMLRNRAAVVRRREEAAEKKRQEEAAEKKRQEEAEAALGEQQGREETARHRIDAQARARTDSVLERQLIEANERIREKDALIIEHAKQLAAKDYEISLLSSQNGGLLVKAEGHEDCLAIVRAQQDEIRRITVDAAVAAAVAKVDGEHKDALIEWLEERLDALEPKGTSSKPRPSKRSITPADMPAVPKEQPK